MCYNIIMTVPRYPNNTEWQKIQGGEPLIVANEEATLFQIVHVYGEIEENTRKLQLKLDSPIIDRL
jgi:hypothetical protein